MSIAISEREPPSLGACWEPRQGTRITDAPYAGGTMPGNHWEPPPRGRGPGWGGDRREPPRPSLSTESPRSL